MNYEKLQPIFDNTLTTGDSIVATLVITIFFVVGMIIALRAACKRMVDTLIPEENDKEEN